MVLGSQDIGLDRVKRCPHTYTDKNAMFWSCFVVVNSVRQVQSVCRLKSIIL